MTTKEIQSDAVSQAAMVSASGLDIIGSRRPSKLDALQATTVASLDEPDPYLRKEPLSPLLTENLCEMLGTPQLKNLLSEMVQHEVQENRKLNNAGFGLEITGFAMTEMEDSSPAPVKRKPK